MKKGILLLAAFGMIASGTYAQTQKTNRTHSRPHNHDSTTNGRTIQKDEAPTDMDRNNPNNTTNGTNTNGTRTNTGGTNTNTNK